MKATLIVFSALLLSLGQVLAAGFDDNYTSYIMEHATDTNEQQWATASSGPQGRLLLAPLSRQFNCEVVKDQERPSSVHKLRPGDINAIGAIGDSLTAANGAKASTILGLLEECRGVAWNMGGETSDLGRLFSLPNILRRFNPNLKGFSTASSKNSVEDKAGFNMANPGDTSHEMFGQASSLFDRMRTSNKIDFQNDWKLITFFIGGNDLCKSCKDVNKYTVKKYVDNIRNTLDFFKANFPRTMINLVNSLDVRVIRELPGITCRNMQQALCSCGLSDSFAATLKELTSGYQKGIEELIATGRYDTSDDFTVVTQQFMKNAKAPRKANGSPDYGFFSPDCFHFSSKGHEHAAAQLWDNMLTPVGRKADYWKENLGFACPTASAPYIFTNKNSAGHF